MKPLAAQDENATERDRQTRRWQTESKNEKQVAGTNLYRCRDHSEDRAASRRLALERANKLGEQLETVMEYLHCEPCHGGRAILSD